MCFFTPYFMLLSLLQVILVIDICNFSGFFFFFFFGGGFSLWGVLCFLMKANR